MDENKITELLLKLHEDMAYVKAKLSNLDELKIATRVDALEANVKEHNKRIESSEHRHDVMEEFMRKNMQEAQKKQEDALKETKKQQTGILISMGIAIFTAILNIIIGLF